jgi:hypothetical protein
MAIGRAKISSGCIRPVFLKGDHFHRAGSRSSGYLRFAPSKTNGVCVVDGGVIKIYIFMDFRPLLFILGLFYFRSKSKETTSASRISICQEFDGAVGYLLTRSDSVGWGPLTGTEGGRARGGCAKPVSFRGDIGPTT